jgi:hypothetical protein
MNDRSDISSGHLGAKLGEVAPKNGLLCATVIRANVAWRTCHSTKKTTALSEAQIMNYTKANGKSHSCDITIC